MRSTLNIGTLERLSFLGPLLTGFKGVLVSDFFTGYDSLIAPNKSASYILYEK